MMMEMIASEVANEKIRLLKRAEYERLGSLGFFEDERVELLFGVVVEMPPIDQAHIHASGTLHTDLAVKLGNRANIYSASPFAASDVSLPEPDVYVTEPGDRWSDRPTHAFLIIEVSRSSLARDRGVKSLLYGLSDVDEYWIVDQIHGFVEVYRDRHEDGSWRTKITYGRGETITLLAFPDVSIATDRVLPPPGA